MDIMSPQIDQLATALAKAQPEFKAYKNKNNPFFKNSYADLESIIEACREPLGSNGLSFIQSVYQDQGEKFLVTRLLHSSGQWIDSKVKLEPADAKPQTLMSYTTYMKRMCLQALLGITVGEQDDDGEAATIPYRNKITAQQKETLLSCPPERQAGMLKYFKLRSFDDMNIAQFDEALRILSQPNN